MKQIHVFSNKMDRIVCKNSILPHATRENYFLTSLKFIARAKNSSVFLTKTFLKI